MSVERITPGKVQELLAAREPIEFLDARNPTDWGASGKKIPGGMRAREDEQVKRLLAELPKNHTLVAYCT